MSYPRPMAVLLALVLAIGFTACSNSSTSTAPAANAPQASTPAAQPAAQPAASAGATTDKGFPHPCTLLTQKDAEEVAGPGATVKRESVDECDVQATQWDNVLSVKIEEVDLSTWDGGETMMKFDKTAKKVAGIGEDAYSYMDGNIVFKKGKASVTVIVSAYKGPKAKFDAAKYIAERVAAGL
jgi:hypothetical protein